MTACHPDTDVIARAEAAIASLADSYVDWAEAESMKMCACMRRMSDPFQRKETVAEIFHLAHDMKGQAATFGYPLWTDIAGRLCHLIRGDNPAPDHHIAAHITVLADAIARRLKSGSDKEGRKVLAKLGM